MAGRTQHMLCLTWLWGLHFPCSLWKGTASKLDFSFSPKEKPQVACLVREVSLPCPLHTSVLCRAAGISSPACCSLL